MIFLATRSATASFLNCATLLAHGEADEKAWLKWYEFDPLYPAADGKYKYQKYYVQTFLNANDRHLYSVTEAYYDPKDRTRYLLRYAGLPFETRRDILRSIYRNYSEKKFSEILPALSLVESELFIQRMNYGVIRERSGGEIVGTLRAYDGTASHYPTDPRMPIERIFDQRGAKTTSIDRLRADHPSSAFFEMGNFLIDAPSRALRKKTKAVLLTLWLERYAKRFPKAQFIAHVASEAHATLYSREYGFKVIQKLWMPDIGGYEMVMANDAENLAEHLERAIALLLR